MGRISFKKKQTSIEISKLKHLISFWEGKISEMHNQRMLAKRLDKTTRGIIIISKIQGMQNCIKDLKELINAK
jgi:ribosomal protein S6